MSHVIHQIARGSVRANNAYTGALGELVMDITNNDLVLHNGSTKGGTRLAKYKEVTSSNMGLMLATDKIKLDTIEDSANNYTHPITSGNKHIPSGGTEGQILRWSADGTAVWGNDNNTTYNEATQTTSGLESANDKKVIDNLLDKMETLTAQMSTLVNIMDRYYSGFETSGD